MGWTLTYLTLAVVLVVVLALVVYLVGIILALRRATQNLGQVAEGLASIEHNTAPLSEKLTTINGALSQLLTGLLAVDDYLGGIARLIGR